MGAAVDLVLPWPPSVNTLWRNVRIGARQATLLSEAGRKYFDVAAVEVAKQRAGIRFAGVVSVDIVLHAPTRRHYDIDNRIKATLDAMTHGGMWHDDGQVDVLIVRRGEVRRDGGAAIVRVEEIGQ